MVIIWGAEIDTCPRVEDRIVLDYMYGHGGAERASGEHLGKNES